MAAGGHALVYAEPWGWHDPELDPLDAAGVEITTGREYHYVRGLDMNDIRIPRGLGWTAAEWELLRLAVDLAEQKAKEAVGLHD